MSLGGRQIALADFEHLDAYLVAGCFDPLAAHLFIMACNHRRGVCFAPDPVFSGNV
jgi:hypothetical protein